MGEVVNNENRDKLLITVQQNVL